MKDQVTIDYFSDTLCIWAYISEIRLEELSQKFASRIKIVHHYMPTFACTEKRIGQGWENKGGYEGFGDHVRSVSNAFEHITISPKIWSQTRPTTSTTSHLYLKAIQLLQDKGVIAVQEEQEEPSSRAKTPFKKMDWLIRRAFFEQAMDISNLNILRQLAHESGLPVADIDILLETGEAHAALAADTEMRNHYHLQGSPSYILNGGRQILYGNVGYKIIEANVLEILKQPNYELSWC
jgi:predicted DsbA family dithiol-disulfide isomerase